MNPGVLSGGMVGSWKAACEGTDGAALAVLYRPSVTLLAKAQKTRTAKKKPYRDVRQTYTTYYTPGFPGVTYPGFEVHGLRKLIDNLGDLLCRDLDPHDRFRILYHAVVLLVAKPPQRW